MVVIEAMVGFCSDLRVEKGNLLWGFDNGLVAALALDSSSSEGPGQQVLVTKCLYFNSKT